MHLVMFDIDGTLTETMAVDEVCYLDTLEEVYGTREIDTDWSAYPHTTDTGVFGVTFRRLHGRDPTDEDTRAFQVPFFSRLEALSRAAPFAQIGGAGTMLDTLATREDVTVALATGAWSGSARIKMGSAGLDFARFPSATADDGLERETIMTVSLRRARERARRERFDSFVYVGDAVWDARACARLGVPLIGIATGARAERLLAEGAAAVLPNYRDLDTFLARLDKLW
jgi:phosphoglycolate phosphatase-like HAD superfamily hydrolase